MALNPPTYAELALEWEFCMSAKDLEATAELGRTLLERNRELESIIRQQQAQLDDQAQEMQYVTKQNSLLRQAAESRLRLCEQLECSVAELERTKSRALCELSLERHRQRRLRADLETVEEKCFELQRTTEQMRSSELQSQLLVRSLRTQLSLERVKVSAEDDDVPEQLQSEEESSPKVDEAFLHMAEALLEVEEKLKASARETLEERKKRLELESELRILQEELCFFQQQTSGSCSPESPSKVAKKRLSICEELILSSGEFWDSAQPLSLSETGASSLLSFAFKDDDFSSDCDKIHSLKRINENEDVYSSSSGFSEEGSKSDAAQGCVYQCAYCRCVSTTPSSCSSADVTKTVAKYLEETRTKLKENASDVTSSDVKNLFQEIFAVLRQHL